MFDKLIESEPEGAEFRNRRWYFMVSSLVVGVLFATAVVISIFAGDIGLGSSNFELTEMLAPVEMAATEPETPQTRLPAASLRSESRLPTRPINMERVDEAILVPTTTSVVANSQSARPNRPFDIGPLNTDPSYSGTSGRDHTNSGPPGGGLLQAVAAETETIKPPEPPPAKPPTANNPPVPSLGVVNGRATSLPKPFYTAAAISVRAQGKVDVQVTIDETGHVTSAHAVSGHLLLRPEAERAARRAVFTPTLLSNKPVKVTGVIIYNFTR